MVNLTLSPVSCPACFLFIAPPLSFLFKPCRGTSCYQIIELLPRSCWFSNCLVGQPLAYNLQLLLTYRCPTTCAPTSGWQSMTTLLLASVLLLITCIQSLAYQPQIACCFLQLETDTSILTNLLHDMLTCFLIDQKAKPIQCSLVALQVRIRFSICLRGWEKKEPSNWQF